MRYAVFGGTYEGRRLCGRLTERGRNFVVFTATDRGAEVLPEGTPHKTGRMDEAQIEKELKDFDIVIDATHPYAQNVTENIKTACNRLKKRYIRLLRDEIYCENALYFDDIAQAAEFLNKCGGRIFISTGSRDAEKYTAIKEFSDRTVIRILDADEPIKKCRELGFKHIITGMGPFSETENIRDFGDCKWLITKSSGTAGGFEEKISAAEKLGMNIIVIKRPKESGYTLEEVMESIERFEKKETTAGKFITEPSEIEKRSMEIIGERLRDKKIDGRNLDVVKRVIHTTADFDFADSLVFSENAVDILAEKLKNGANIVTDTNMALAGINKGALKKAGIKAYCFMADEDVAQEAKKRGITRAAVSVEKAAQLKGETVFAVGNAPTALIAIDRMVRENLLTPAFVIGVPVGFVNVAESKELIINGSTPHIVSRGNKGGSAVAAAIVNAVLYKMFR